MRQTRKRAAAEATPEGRNGPMQQPHWPHRKAKRPIRHDGTGRLALQYGPFGGGKRPMTQPGKGHDAPLWQRKRGLAAATARHKEAPGGRNSHADSELCLQQRERRICRLEARRAAQRRPRGPVCNDVSSLLTLRPPPHGTARRPSWPCASAQRQGPRPRNNMAEST